MTDFILMFAGLARTLLGLALLLFIPGFALSLVFYPGLSDIPYIERFVFSGIASIGIAITATIFMDVLLGVETDVMYTMFFLILITATVLCWWRIECAFLKKYGTPESVPYQTRIYRASQQVSHNVLGTIKNYSDRIIHRIGK